ncbi:MAPEG family protein [Shewanella sp. WXL01]|uniref:MAPEG family protein n=1 Tax=Shewanella sp. WXL01 TaxID=2709721 RepID=UPI001438302F|nr:MAPEG family protein [Shewanella sp. WXL01]NKF52210.1 MAPEG family protein [Shewanella sp. WXL01]
MSFLVSGLYVSLTALLIIALSLYVIKMRRKHRVGIGDGEHRELSIAIRTQANLIENAPIVLLLIVLAEANGLSILWLHLLGCVWLFARIIHPYGLVKSNGGIHWGRYYGMALTWIVVLALAGVNVGFYLGHVLD